MTQFGVFMLIMGLGSLLLPFMGVQFRLMSLLDSAQPIAGIALAVVGGLLIFLGARQKSSE